MTQASLAKLESLRHDLREHGWRTTTCEELAYAIDLIIDLFDQAEEELTKLAGCVDDLALATKHHLGEPGEEADNG